MYSYKTALKCSICSHASSACFQELPQERLLIAGLGCASAEFMFEETREYVKNRKAFGRTLAHLQVRARARSSCDVIALFFVTLILYALVFAVADDTAQTCRAEDRDLSGENVLRQLRAATQ